MDEVKYATPARKPPLLDTDANPRTGNFRMARNASPLDGSQAAQVQAPLQDQGFVSTTTLNDFMQLLKEETRTFVSESA